MIHLLINIFAIAISAVIAGTNDFVAIAKWGRTKLELIEISGSLVTIDAMDYQAEIGRQIVAQKADYCLAVKGSQPTLHRRLMEHFENHLADDFARTKVWRHQTHEQGHGREGSG